MNDKFQSILAPFDGSAESEQAFEAMMPVIRSDDPEVTVLYVFEDPEAADLPPKSVVRFCVSLQKKGVRAHLSLRRGKPADEILLVAKERFMDLIVMSTAGRGGLQRVLMGSVAEKVLRKAEVPVLLTRPGTATRSWTRMVVALDGSSRGEEILKDVLPLSRRLNASVELVHAALPALTMSGLGEVPGVVIHEDPLPYLRKVQASLAKEGIEAQVAGLEGNPASEIVGHAEESGATLLCLTTHGRSGLGRALLGSVAEEVLRQAPCPVLIRRTVNAEAMALEPRRAD